MNSCEQSICGVRVSATNDLYAGVRDVMKRRDQLKDSDLNEEEWRGDDKAESGDGADEAEKKESEVEGATRGQTLAKLGEVGVFISL